MSFQNFRSPWGSDEKTNWFTQQTIKRSYATDVVTRIEALKAAFEVTQYGALSLDPRRYPLFSVRTRNFDPAKKTILVTGGVHGYETSGVHGALSFMSTQADRFAAFNILCFPCISPWGYETINRWNPLALDPNRNFFPGSACEESAAFMRAIDGIKATVFAHFDLHETTDTDNTVFRPALASRDGKEEKFSEIPDGFYLVGDVNRPERAFQKAIIDAVRKVTHIAPADAEGKLIGVPLDQEGVVYYDKRKLFLCGGATEARFTTTTEVYPDSPKATPEICINAQVAAISGGLEYIGRP